MLKSIFTASAAAVLTLASCNDSGTTTTGADTSTTNTTTDPNTTGDLDTGTSTTGTTDTMPMVDSSGVMATDKEFAMKAASGGLAEVELANLALSQGQHERVKAFANMMIADHTKANDELKAIAARKGITLPTAPLPEDAKHKDHLSGKTGAAFDKAYMSMMVSSHDKTLKVMDMGMKSGVAELKDFATKTKPVVKMHIDSAKVINKVKM